MSNALSFMKTTAERDLATGGKHSSSSGTPPADGPQRITVQYNG